jgi:DNA-binding response OmpR family regulator
MATRRVLIVDDEPTRGRRSRPSFARCVIRIRGKSKPCPTAAVVRQRPDLVLLDLQKPRMGGLALLKQTREVEPRLLVIVIGATQENKMSAEALRNGAVAYLPKSFDPRHVEMLVSTFSTRPSLARRSRSPARALIRCAVGLLGCAGHEPIAALHALQSATARRRKNAGLAPSTLAPAVGRWRQFSGRDPVADRPSARERTRRTPSGGGRPVPVTVT